MFSDWAPPLILISVLFYALLEGPLFGFLLGLYAGFFVDLFGVEKLGIEMGMYGCFGLLSGYAKSKVFHESLLTQILFPAVGCYLFSYLDLVAQGILSQQESFGFALFHEAFSFPTIVSTMILSPVIFWLLYRLSLTKKNLRAPWRPR